MFFLVFTNLLSMDIFCNEQTFYNQNLTYPTPDLSFNKIKHEKTGIDFDNPKIDFGNYGLDFDNPGIKLEIPEIDNDNLGMKIESPEIDFPHKKIKRTNRTYIRHNKRKTHTAEETRERKRIHAKQTRERKKKYFNELNNKIKSLYKQNQIIKVLLKANNIPIPQTSEIYD